MTSGDPSSVPHASAYYNSTDLYWLSRIISAEAKGEPLAGQIAVGNVVLNRTRSAAFPNTVKDVIFDKKYGAKREYKGFLYSHQGFEQHETDTNRRISVMNQLQLL